MGLFKDKSTFQKFTEKVTNVIVGNPNIDEEFYEELEESLVISDIGIETTDKIMDMLRKRINAKYLTKPEDIKRALADVIAEIVDKGDTFRAAAADQLVEWGNRSGVRVIRHEEGTDPAAVIYDAVQSARANDIDVLICDTAGRLQNKTNLMKELEKMDKIISREYPEASRETLIVLDSTTGKNAISQAKEFSEIADITGIVLTKLDGTARGGISITVTDEYDLPIKFIGVGEGIHDLKEFDPKEFAGGIFDE